MGVAPFAAGLRRARLVPTQGSRQNGPLSWLASVTRPCSCRPCPSLASAALFLPRQGLSVSAIRGSWLTKNPLLKSESDKLETMLALFAVRGVRGGRKIRAKPVMSHLAYYVIDEPRRIVFIIDVAAGAQGPKRD